VGWSEPVFFGKSDCHVFGTFRIEAIIIMRCHEVPYRLPVTVKCLILSETDVPFYAKICLVVVCP